MDLSIAVCRHDVKHAQLVLQHLGIALIIHKRQRGAPAPDIISIDRTIAIVSIPIWNKIAATIDLTYPNDNSLY